VPDDPKRTPSELKAYERLKKVRASKTVKLKPIARLRDQIRGLDGKMQPFNLRYYQVQGVYHMMVLKRMMLGDGTGLGKTVETLVALSYLWLKEPKNKVLIVAPKSAIRQWASEIKRFTKDVKVIVVTSPKGKAKGGALEHRKKLYQEWANAPTGPKDPKVVLVLNYALLQRDWNAEGYQPLKPNGRPDPKKPVIPGILNGITQKLAADLIVIYDECTAFKNMRTKTWEVCRFLSERAARVYGLTATLLKNHLMEGYCIYKALKPDLFGTKTKFLDDYCYTKMQAVSRGRQIPIVLGYKNLDHFRMVIDPFFLGRAKHAVSDELPTLTTREVLCEMNKGEDSKYAEALTGVLELGDGDIRDYEEHKALVSLTYCQQVVNSLTMLRYAEGDDVEGNLLFDEPAHKLGSMGAKEQALVDLITGELDGEKVIVYTRFESLVARLQAILKREGVKSTRITGKENDAKREKHQAAFQDLESDTSVIFITDAGSEAINLQAAVAEIFYDAPYSWGDYVQTLGRMIRIGSPHTAVLAYHLIAERPSTNKKSRKTIDHHVLSLLRKKKGLIDKVLGEAAVGALKFDKPTSSARQLLKALRDDA